MSAREIRLPALSATMESATLLAWKVGAGDQIIEGQAIAEVSTDKVDMDLEAPFSGQVLTLAVEPGDEIALGAVLATIESETSDLLEGLDLATPSDLPAPVVQPESASAAAESPRDGHVTPASPAARALARDASIDLSAVTPSGRRGQVTEEDVRSAMPSTEPAQTDSPPDMASEPGPGDTKRVATRRATATAMQRSAVIPQFTIYRTLDLEDAAATRGSISWTTLIVRALAQALRAHPDLNAFWDETTKTIKRHPDTKIGVAVDRPGVGLVVTTIADPDLATVETADLHIRAAIDRARTGKVHPDDMAPASMSLSNLGGLGVDRFNALLFPPQALILSIGSIKHRATASADGSLKATLTAHVGLTVDHRVGDGADAAQYLESLAQAFIR